MGLGMRQTGRKAIGMVCHRRLDTPSHRFSRRCWGALWDCWPSPWASRPGAGASAFSAERAGVDGSAAETR